MPGSGFVPSLADTDQPGARFRRRDLLRTVAEGTAGAVGDEFLRCLVRHVAMAFDAKFAFVAEATDPNGEHVRVVSGWYDGAWMDEPLEYDTRGKPCALVVERAVVAFPEALTRRFPEAKPAIDMGLESYLAICLRAADGTHLGHMAVMDAGRMEAEDDDVAAMRIFASRAAAEMERRHQAAALRASRTRVIEAADAERRRVGRNLHDGAQQQLLAVGNLLRLAQRKLERDSEAVDVLRLACDELGEAQAELQQLARGLHPVALAERGLRGALESLTVGREPSVRLEVVADGLPEDIELAAYFIASEALTNARKYADADAVSIHVVPGAEGLLV
jgi:signal transduction histidine kinase